MAQERKKVVTPPFRVSFPSVFTKSEFGEGKPKYSVVALFYPGKMNDKEKAQFKAMQGLLDEACRGKFGKPLVEMAKNPNFKRGLRKGEEKADLDGYGEGCVFATLSTLNRPGLIDKEKQPILSEEDFYAGCWARATVTAYGYDNKSKGVAIGLQNLQKLGEGDPFSSRVAAEEDFGDDADEVWGGSEVAPAAEGDDFLDS
jgi:hypothetical protein